jgi:hypothetical protein
VPGLAHAKAFGEEAGQQPLGRWDVTFSEADLEDVVPDFLTASLVLAGQPRIRLRADTIDDIWIICRYSASSP